MVLSHHASLETNPHVLIYESSSVFFLKALVLGKSASWLFCRMPLYVTKSDF